MPDFDPSGFTPFTMGGRDISKRIWKMLLQTSYRCAASFSRKRFGIDTVYHFEIFMTSGDSNNLFALTAEQLQKVCRHQ